MACIPLGLGRFLGKTLGIFISLLPFKRLKVSLDNIQNTLGGSLTGPEASRLNRRVYMHFGQALFELSRIFRMNNKNLDKYIVLEGEDNLTKALAKGKGVFLLSAHIGNWEMITAAVSIRYGRLSAIASTQHSPAVDRLIKTIRTRFGMEVIPKKQGLKMMISAVKRNRIVGILLDLNSKWDQGVFVDFLGRPACTNKSLAVMVLKMDTPVIPAFSIREKDGLYHIYLGEEIKPIRTGDRTMDIEENTALFTRIIEAQVRKNPDQWLWVHRRWKTLPFCPLH